ncbi:MULTISPECIES: two-component system response regulator [unclassified Methylophilus]|uniref:response regulator n=1 Tax=unclassified Methylophilus TaxID=2630143 RepID=UPI0006F4F924|nr:MULTISPECIES: two-component system response regulator [unclassified Methylophilus]KQT41291.1 two-component system response regulator [Methylophilus sp. Leaf416]KQT57812.1 two-component system response regulator [Methylophilus sp. Leaf459]
MTDYITQQPRILIVDDEPLNLKVLKQVLQDDYRLSFAKNGMDALELVKKEKPRLILLDVMMPGMTGFEVCKQLKDDPDTQTIPVIFVTALADETDESQGFKAGGVDYINKPISPAIVRARVKTHLSLIHIDELKSTHLELIQRLGRAAEFKDNETGMHVIRMSHVSGRIALEMGMDAGFAEQLVHAAPMHDIGKIGIPDQVLLKPGKLDEEELATMRTHPQLGADILDKSTSPLIKLAYTVALYHHEKWDGTGYPYGLKGEEIPIEARIVAIADVFDALLSKRPYKEAWPIDKVVEEIKSQSNRHFDPAVVEALLNCLPDLIAINAKWREE